MRLTLYESNRVVFLPGIIRKQNQTKETRALLRLERTMNLIQGRGGRDGGRERGGRKGREGGMTVIGMFNSNPIIPQYLNNNLT